MAWKTVKCYGLPMVGFGAIGYTLIDLSGYSLAQICGRSMQPTLNPHLSNTGRCEPKRQYKDSLPWQFIGDKVVFLDWVLISSKDRYNVKPGEIVTLHNALSPNDRDIKRVVAVGNQLVKSRTYKNRIVVVPKGYIWVEGDHPVLSKDSNTYGPIPASLVFGKAAAIIWPPSRWQRLGTDKPNTASTHLNASEILHQKDKEPEEE